LFLMRWNSTGQLYHYYGICRLNVVKGAKRTN
jgi:hypothetical protein